MISVGYTSSWHRHADTVTGYDVFWGGKINVILENYINDTFFGLKDTGCQCRVGCVYTPFCFIAKIQPAFIAYQYKNHTVYVFQFHLSLFPKWKCTKMFLYYRVKKDKIR